MLTKLISRWPPLFNAAATLQAVRMHQRRYGPLYRQAIASIETRSRATRAEVDAYSLARLNHLLLLAKAHVPHYRSVLRDAKLPFESLDELRRLPLLDKTTVRERAEEFLDERLRRRAFLRLSTSGTTGTPIRLYRTRKVEQWVYAYFEARCRRPLGFRFMKDPFASVGGRVVADPNRKRPPFWCYNHLWKQLYLSSYHLSDDLIGHYLDELNRRPYRLIMGYPSGLHALARFALSHGRAPLGIPLALTSAETLFEHQRRDIERGFGCRVYDQYGCGEHCAMAFECKCNGGGLHISTDFALIEVLRDDGTQADPGEVGEIVGTSLINEGQVFIRYRLGDRGAMSDRPCPCGSAFPILESLEGRVDKVLITADGRRIGRLDPVLKGVDHVAECQIVQRAIDHFTFRVVAAVGFDDHDAEKLRANLAERVGRGRIDVERVAEIPRTKAGKFEAIVSEIEGAA